MSAELTPAMREALWPIIRDNEIRPEFERMGIYFRCELCQGTFGLAFAHRRKRRLINTIKELYIVARLCSICHQRLDEGRNRIVGGEIVTPHEYMFAVITGIRVRTPVKGIEI